MAKSVFSSIIISCLFITIFFLLYETIYRPVLNYYIANTMKLSPPLLTII